jgi:hypothetical protein
MKRVEHQERILSELPTAAPEAKSEKEKERNNCSRKRQNRG